MEVSSTAMQQTSAFGQHEAFTSTDGAMDIDIRDDMDIDFTGDPEIIGFEEEGAIDQASAFDAQTASAGQIMDDSAATAGDIAAEKVHISKGLDHLSTEQVKHFIFEFYPTDNFFRIEWINDYSANVVYNNSIDAAQALAAFTDESLVDISSLSPQDERETKRAALPADKSSKETLGYITLTVRQGRTTDVKAVRAHEASRYYLLNPDQDPRERKRQYNSRRDGRSERGDYRRRRFDDREHQRRREGGDRFDVNMYDDDAGEEEAKPGRSTSEDGYRRRPRRGEEDLFDSHGAGRSSGRLRDRSASPLGDGDGRFGFREDQPMRRRARYRSATPERLRRPIEREYSQPNAGMELFPVSKTTSSVRTNAGKELFPGTGRTNSALSNTGKELFPGSGRRGSAPSNAGKELFPGSRPTSSALSNGGPVKELFPEKIEPKSPKELFPHRTSMSHHRRTPAFDAADETSPSISKPRSLADRITGGPRPILNDRPASRTGQDADSQGFGIRGAAAQQTGFSIRGASANAPTVAKELFPLKAGKNAGKELFGERIKGRGGARRRAEDMF